MIYPMTEYRQGLFDSIDAHIAYLGWSEKDCRDYLQYFYRGSISRHQLEDGSLKHLDRQLEEAAKIIRNFRSEDERKNHEI